MVLVATAGRAQQIIKREDITMAIVNSREINKKLNCALKCFKEAIDLARKNLVVGEINYAGGKPGRKPRAKKATTSEPPTVD